MNRVEGRFTLHSISFCMFEHLTRYLCYSSRTCLNCGPPGCSGERTRAEAENLLEGSGCGPVERWWWLDLRDW